MRIGLTVKSLLVGAALLTPFGESAEAATITFGGPAIGGYTSGTFTESGFIYSVFSGGLFVNNLGNPGQDMEGWTQQAGGGVLQITRVGGLLFTFDALDFSAFDATSPTPSGSQTLSVTGFLGGSAVGTELFVLQNTATFFPTYANWTTFGASSLLGDTIDTLRITLLATSLSNESIDNVVLTPIATSAPEPTSMLLLATGAAVGAAVRRRRRRA